jgi:uncharacterized protein (TIGR01777 family)
MQQKNDIKWLAEWYFSRSLGSFWGSLFFGNPEKGAIWCFFWSGSGRDKLVGASGCFLSIFDSMNAGPQAFGVGTRVLITGASGLVGRALTELLLAEGYGVVHLVRPVSQKLQFISNPERGIPMGTGSSPVMEKASSAVSVSSPVMEKSSANEPNPGAVATGTTTGILYHCSWDPERGYIDERAWEGVSAVVHLAGAGVADARWTSARKKEIMESRARSTRLLADCILQRKAGNLTLPACVVSASAIGYYGDAGQRLCRESDPPGTGFLSEVCQQWEAEAQPIETVTRLNILRIGVVISEKGGALSKMALPMRLFAGGVLGSGTQVMSWIHLEDLVRQILHVIQNEQCHGVYNAVAPLPVSQYLMLRALGQRLRRPLWTWIPGPVLRLMLGGMADTVLHSQKVSNERIQSTGFRCRFPSITEALQNLYGA